MIMNIFITCTISRAHVHHHLSTFLETSRSGRGHLDRCISLIHCHREPKPLICTFFGKPKLLGQLFKGSTDILGGNNILLLGGNENLGSNKILLIKFQKSAAKIY